MNEWINEKLLPPVLKFINTKATTALRNGMFYTMPFIIAGSVFLLLANSPVTAISGWVNANGLAAYFNQAYGASLAIVLLFAVIGIAYSYVKSEGFEGLPAGMITMVVFILFMSSEVKDVVSDAVAGNVINKDWIADKGMITTIIIGLLVGVVCSWFLRYDIRIKLPGAVPENVANSFTALIPASVIVTGVMLTFILPNKVFNTTFFDFIYEVLQSPLQGVTDSLGGALLLGFVIPLFWFFGVHGSTIVGGIMGPILQANSLENTEILKSGKDLTLANGGHTVTQQFLDQFLTVTGAGMTTGLIVFMVSFAKSAQFKQLGRLSIGPAVFNISEPIVSATPTVMNPIMAVPFIITPIVSPVVTYFALYTGLVPLFTTVQIPWTTPPIISGLLVGGWQVALLQAVVLTISLFIYLPFAKKMDVLNYVEETNQPITEETLKKVEAQSV